LRLRSHALVVAATPGWQSETTLQRLRQLAAEESGVRYRPYVWVGADNETSST
jgi:hypothetical protein